LHARAHSPAGVGPTPAQWKEVSDRAREKKLKFPFFDMVYRGSASENTTKDGFAVRYFAERGHQIALSQSFMKTTGLYGERAGAFPALLPAAPDTYDRAGVGRQPHPGSIPLSGILAHLTLTVGYPGLCRRAVPRVIELSMRNP